MNKKNNPSTQNTPVVLFVFNRTQELVQTLQCLKENNIPLLYVFADGARNKQEEAKVKAVRDMIDSVDWVTVKKTYHSKNLGLSESIKTGLDKVFAQHNQAVVIEDDVCVAPNFYQYMITCLDKYKSVPQVAGITGLRYPFKREHLDASEYDVFFAHRFSSWGWGTWKDRWQQVDLNKEHIERFVTTNQIDLSRSGDDLPEMIEAIKQGTLTGCWDVYYFLSMVRDNQVFVWPKYNMVANNAIGTGTHASTEQHNWQLDWEKTTNTPVNLPKNVQKNDMIEEDFLVFFSNNKRKIELKKYVKKAANKLGFDVVKLKKESVESSNPKDYTTTAGPQEVPCQKESYFYALNHYIKDGDKVLDVGMGVGYGMNLLSIKAKEVCAVDVDKKAVEYCSKHVLAKNPKVKELKHYDGYHLPYKDNYFDVVTCVDVVEHVEDYHAFIDELLRVAKRTVVFATPNRRPEYTNPDGTPTNHWHLREWSYEEFDKIIKSHVKKVEWTFLDGPWEGPFKITHKVNKDTLVLLPALIKS